MQLERVSHTRTAETVRQNSTATSIKPLLQTRAPDHPILQLQRTIGNQAVAGLLRTTKVTHKSEASVPDNFLHERGPVQPLDSSTRAFFEPRFRHDFSEVPQTSDGRRLLAHELVHTIQQKGETPVTLARQASDFPSDPVPGPTPGKEPDPFKDVGKSIEYGRLVTTWGWGAPETNNIYQECSIAELERSQFRAFFDSLPHPPKRGREKPVDAEEAFGVTQYNAGAAVPPRIGVTSIQEGKKTVFKLQPTHAEMPPIRSAFTKAGRFTEGTRQYIEEECKGERIRLGTSKFPIHWNLTEGGATKFKEAEQEHCNDIRLAFDLTLGLYASAINNEAAAERTYSSEKQTTNRAIQMAGVQPDEMLRNFAEMALKTKHRDLKDWHTANKTLPTRAHREKPGQDNNCQHRETIDAQSLPDISQHSSYEVMELPPVT